ncbi:CHALLAH-LIKE2 like [Actinidia chinensis var. chinensis]|uniref:Epidermal patterning factor-like protein n=1 Tax=Actinidia chinensis var. chinensis TaxID=1590841 RepID=A0A2R6PL12_ACTCC|nr:CHALLAH-LIKE2 like [Actinidia chinensis var. chinensis]
MGVVRHRQRLSLATVTALAFVLFAYASALSLGPTRQLGGGEIEEREASKITPSESAEVFVSGGVVTRRRLGGPGSSPPTCRSKCGPCGPCRPVHVPIQPGLSMPLEYYPEAWRCKCGNKLFMP